jgi:hypothetical protein
MSDEAFPRERDVSVDWSELHHAYGPAGDIPTLLQDARRAPAPSDYRDEPWFSLWSALCHQGDVFTASYAAVPELMAIAEARHTDPMVECECLYLAAMIELERSAPDGLTPPPALPAELTAAYRTAIARGAWLAENAMARGRRAPAREMLKICSAIFAGNLPRARRLVDGPDEDEAG